MIRLPRSTRRPHLARMLVAVTAMAALLAACGEVEEPADPGEPSEEPADEDTDDPENGMEPDDNGDNGDAFSGEIDIAVADAAAHFDVDPDDIEVVTAEAVTWPDGAIGCPEPDMMYTQALVEGYRIVLSVDGEEVAYHGEDGGDPARCDDPQDPVS
ncbi:MAG: hypothetical protein EA388_09415 [Nitriliruptor sp.]|nr:MAG: hypothetical protein EA388_09415 [Nitriliruptor sp.]